MLLSFVDPQGVADLKWETLETLLKHGTGDIILNFPTMGINRNLNNEDCIPVLTEFLGTEDWIGKDIDYVFNQYKSRIAMHRQSVSSIEVLDEKNRRLYDLVFTTGSVGMRNALEDVKKRLNEIETKTIRGLYEVVAENQKQITEFWTKNGQV
jgi:three-Cys-motif partner protein